MQGIWYALQVYMYLSRLLIIKDHAIRRAVYFRVYVNKMQDPIKAKKPALWDFHNNNYGEWWPLTEKFVKLKIVIIFLLDSTLKFSYENHLASLIPRLALFPPLQYCMIKRLRSLGIVLSPGHSHIFNLGMGLPIYQCQELLVRM